jgi:hypothetical protein
MIPPTPLRVITAEFLELDKYERFKSARFKHATDINDDEFYLEHHFMQCALDKHERRAGIFHYGRKNIEKRHSMAR